MNCIYIISSLIPKFGFTPPLDLKMSANHSDKLGRDGVTSYTHPISLQTWPRQWAERPNLTFVFRDGLTVNPRDA